ncbi:MAG TPA: PD-(D/E)XK nuclease family protein [Anaeromyxobacteraceae bacterium]|nr:PD-(D/E)XK nuclease family protein [Anaeromyxobacteraceae bacterium]
MPRASAELQNEFSWSKSRHEKLEDCPRAYYYHYYGSWGGWEAAAGTPTRELYVLKKLSSRWQWAGSVVHEALRHMLNRARMAGDRKGLEELVAQTRQRSRAIWSSSRDKSYWREATRIVGLLEHEYGEPVPAEEWKRVWDEVIEGSIRAFYRSETFDRIRAVPAADWLTVDELDSWAFEGTKVWVAIDFAYRDERGRIHVLDWKTGRERGVDHTQVAIYALYARQKWGVPPEAVQGSLVYLCGGEERVDVDVDPTSLARSEGKMRESIAGMKALLDDPQRNQASMARFAPIEDRGACRRCPFRRPCGRM